MAENPLRGGSKKKKGGCSKKSYKQNKKMLSVPLTTPAEKKDWCCYPHRSRDSVFLYAGFLAWQSHGHDSTLRLVDCLTHN